MVCIISLHKHFQAGLGVLLCGQYLNELIVATSIKHFLMGDVPQMNLGYRQTSGNCGYPGCLNCSCATLCQQTDTACPHTCWLPPLTLQQGMTLQTTTVQGCRLNVTQLHYLETKPLVVLGWDLQCACDFVVPTQVGLHCEQHHAHQACLSMSTIWHFLVTSQTPASNVA